MNKTFEPNKTDTTRPSAATHTAHVISLNELHEHGEPGKEPLVAVQRQENPLHQIKTSLQVCVGEVTLTIGDLLAAKENQVLVLDRAVDHPVDMLLEGKVVARGQLVAIDDQFAVRITELPIPLKP